MFLFYHCIALGQELPVDRFVDWSNPGNQFSVTTYDTLIDVLDFGFDNSGQNPNDSLLEIVLTQKNHASIELFFPQGEYLFERSIRLSSNTSLRGEGSGLTHLIFDLSSQSNAIIIEGEIDRDTFYLNADIKKDNNRLNLDLPNDFSVGDLFYLFEDDVALVSSSWALHSTGQICQILNIEAHNQIQVKDRFRRSFKLDNKPRIRKINPIEQVHLSQFSIVRLDETSNQTSNVKYSYAKDCSMTCVESYNSNFAHVAINFSTNLTIEGNYFEGAFDHGGGGKAYGVVLQFGTGQCLVTRNIFKDLRHSILLQAGPNGNVISFNYSRDPFWEGVLLPSNAAGDLVLHGNYPYHNLFESNTAQQIVIDDSHGINGPNNCFFRNRLELYGIFMNNNPASDHQIFIGNEITNGGAFLGNYRLEGEGHYQYGNYVKGKILPENIDSLGQNSLYLVQNIESYINENAWPPIGYPNDPEDHLINAQSNFTKEQLSDCFEEVLISQIDKFDSFDPLVLIIPNPVDDYLRIEGVKEKIIGLDIYNTNGALVASYNYAEQVDCRRLASGAYKVLILLENSRKLSTTFIKK